MPRPLRVQFAGGVFHVTARGNRKADIFRDDSDRRLFLRILDATIARCRWRCHVFCLMPNHVHVVIETPEPNLSSGMQRLNGMYGQCFNHRHDLSGHLFQGRFHSKLVESNWHLLELSRYVVLNPVRAGLCARPEDWPWSSYRAMTGRAISPRFLVTDWLLNQFGKELDRARSSYAEFVAAAPRRQ